VKSIILPGTILEENTLLGAQALLPKFKTIPKGEKYGGVPAKTILSPQQKKGVTE
jgi:acetyltransferase-like isoleucine patch superfamily enzyme